MALKVCFGHFFAAFSIIIICHFGNLYILSFSTALLLDTRLSSSCREVKGPFGPTVILADGQTTGLRELDKWDLRLTPVIYCFFLLNFFKMALFQTFIITVVENIPWNGFHFVFFFRDSFCWVVSAIF